MSLNVSLVGVTSHTTPLPAGEGMGEGPLSCVLEMCAKNLRELCALCERKISPRLSSVFFFSQKNTEEQNTQRPTETLSQPISQNLTATFSLNVLWYLYTGGVLWVRNSAQKGSAKSVSSVREKTPQRVSQLFFLSQKNTDEQISQRCTETLSQPISQNVTATFSSNALWTLYAGGLLWARNSAKKCSVNSVRSVRDKTPLRVSKMFFFSQKDTDEQNTQRSTETLSQPISQNLTATEASPHCPTHFKNMPFTIREHALLRPRTRPSWCLIRPFFNAVCNLLISCRLQRWMKHTYWTEI